MLHDIYFYIKAIHEALTKVKVKSYDWNYYHVDKATRVGLGN